MTTADRADRVGRGMLIVVMVLVLVFVSIIVLVVAEYRPRGCYISPMGGAPVEAHVLGDVPYVCGDFTTGYRCMKMKPCPEE